MAGDAGAGTCGVWALLSVAARFCVGAFGGTGELAKGRVPVPGSGRRTSLASVGGTISGGDGARSVAA